MRQTMALVHYFGRRFNDAAVEARRALQLQSTLPVARDVLARALLASGSLQEAIDAAAAGLDRKVLNWSPSRAPRIREREMRSAVRLC